MLRLRDFQYTYDQEKLDEVAKKLSLLPKDNINKIILTIDAYSSATIEGAHTTLLNVQRALEKGPYNKDELMCVNTIKAYVKLRDVNTLCEESLIDVWFTIVENCCDNTAAGSSGYRTGMVHVGSLDNIVHVPAKPEDIPDLMSDLSNFSSGHTVLDSILLHFYLVYIHLFVMEMVG